MQIPKIEGTAIVIDDSQLNRQVVVQSLERLGLEIVEFENAATALTEIASMDKSKIKVICSDISMPDIDGLEFCGKIKEDSALNEIPFFFVSGRLDKESILAAKKLNIAGFIVKPLSSDKMIEKISGAIAA